MDDIPESVATMGQAKVRIKEIDEILETGGFKVKEWIISGDRCVFKTEAKTEDQMKWEPAKDKILYNPQLHLQSKEKRKPGLNTSKASTAFMIPEQLTKRQILSQVNGIYDPLCLISPFTVKAKILLIKLWGQDKKLGWDEHIPEGFRKDWVKFFEELPKLANISFSRPIKPIDAVGKPSLVNSLMDPARHMMQLHMLDGI